jgi:putative nucleotidyltransferase with HDIG domain
VAETVTSPELVLSHLDSLPTLPAVAVKLLQVTGDESSAAADIIKLLRGDQSLTAKILSLAGSAASGVRGPITTLEKAVPLLGFATVRSIVLATSVFACFKKQSGEGAAGTFDRLEFWKHSLAVACAARRLAQTRPALAVDPEDAFVAGLLHDLGKVALDAVFPKAYERIVVQTNNSRGDIADNERAVLGADHTVVGRRLAERWRLPRNLQEAIWLHHLAADALPSTVSKPGLIGVVQLADTIAREQRIGYSGNHMFYELSPRLAERLAFPPAHVTTVVQRLAADVAEHTVLLGLDGETSDAVYFQALSRANTELGQLNAELATHNRRLAAGARYFQAMTRFEQALTDWSDPAAVVAALAQAAAMALQRQRAAAFGLRDSASAVDLSWVGPTLLDGGQRTELVAPELAEWLPTMTPPLEALVQPAPPAIRGLLSTVLQPSAEGTPWLLPVFHSGELAGGLVYTAEGDERTRLQEEANDLRSFLASIGLALGRANAQAAARRLSEDLAATNRRLQQMQAELLRSRTLSMIAEMAAGAGHELNSPLTVISGRAQMLAARLTSPEDQRALKQISEKAHECSGIVSELMDFARPRPAQLERVDLAALLGEVRAAWLTQSGMPPSHLRLEFEPSGGDAATPGEPQPIQADREQLKGVFRELISNATDALGADGGTIVIRCRAAQAAETIEVMVTDNGCGMSPTVLQRAFDPFYSHRNAGRRRGLGLPRAYRVLESHGGRIWLESRTDEGTTAHVLLPRAPLPP